MADARRALDWDKMFGIALDPDKARKYRERGCTDEKDGCSMCGDVCAIKIVDRYLKK